MRPPAMAGLQIRGIFMFHRKKEYTGSIDFIIVGLGNPGDKYETTRHNAGFLTIDVLAQKYDCQLKKLKFKSLYGDCRIGDKRVILCKPQTFMNNSGETVRDIAAFYKLPPERVLILYDDISLPCGKIRIRRKGSDGGHNGMKSIIYLTAADTYPRIKIGVGQKPHPDYDLADWVLSSFQKDEVEAMKSAFENAASAAALIVADKIDQAMNKYSK